MYGNQKHSFAIVRGNYLIWNKFLSSVLPFRSRMSFTESQQYIWSQSSCPSWMNTLPGFWTSSTQRVGPWDWGCRLTWSILCLRILTVYKNVYLVHIFLNTAVHLIRYCLVRHCQKCDHSVISYKIYSFSNTDKMKLNALYMHFICFTLLLPVYLLYKCKHLTIF